MTTPRSKAVAAGAVLALVVLASCSFMFPHTELVIAAEGTTLDELGLGLLADMERWVDSLLWLLGLAGL